MRDTAGHVEAGIAVRHADAAAPARLAGHHKRREVIPSSGRRQDLHSHGPRIGAQRPLWPSRPGPTTTEAFAGAPRFILIDRAQVIVRRRRVCRYWRAEGPGPDLPAAHRPFERAGAELPATAHDHRRAGTRSVSSTPASSSALTAGYSAAAKPARTASLSAVMLSQSCTTRSSSPLQRTFPASQSQWPITASGSLARSRSRPRRPASSIHAGPADLVEVDVSFLGDTATARPRRGSRPPMTAPGRAGVRRPGVGLA